MGNISNEISGRLMLEIRSRLNGLVLSACLRLCLLGWPEENFTRYGLPSCVGESLAPVHGSRRDRLLFVDRATNVIRALMKTQLISIAWSFRHDPMKEN